MSTDTQIIDQTVERTTNERTWAYTGKRYTSYRFPADVERDLKSLNELDNWHAPLAWLEDVAWMVGCVLVCIHGSYWFYPAAALIIGARQRGLNSLLHECAHGMATSNRRLQMFLGSALTAYPIFQQHYSYKISHVYTHHPRLGSPDLDPDLRFFVEQGVYEKTSSRRYIWQVVLMPLLGSQTWAYVRYVIRNRSAESGGSRPTSAAQRRKQMLDRLAFWAFWAAVAGVVWQQGWVLEFALFWIVPYLTAFQILGWYIELSEHTPLVRDSSVDLYMTRNRKSRLWERLLAGIHNDHYHLEHHLDPRTPFWQLPQARLIRMRDPNYAAVDARFGGLWHRGPQGQPSAISAIVRYMAREDSKA